MSTSRKTLSTTLSTLLFWTPAAPLLAQTRAPTRAAESPAEDASRSEDLVRVSESIARAVEAPRASIADVRHAEERLAELEQTAAALIRPDVSQVLHGGDSVSQPALTPQALSGTQSRPATRLSAQSVRLPTGQGSIEGFGESFSPNLATGVGTYSIPLAFVAGRGGLGPRLALSYSSGAGQGVVGLGWSLGESFIARDTDRGLPRYEDGPRFHAREDRFVLDGEELVPVDDPAMERVDCGQSGCAPIPAELRGYQQYRARIEGQFRRVFRAPDLSRWVVQNPDGSSLDYGVLAPHQGPGEAVDASEAALERDGSRIHRWRLVRASDAHGNVVHYLHERHGGRSYLRDVYYVSPATACTSPSAAQRRDCEAPFSAWARRVHLVYEPRPDVHMSYATGFAIEMGLRLTRIEHTSNPESPGAQRTLVRRYHLTYDDQAFHSLLTSIVVEGRPSRVDARTGARVGVADVPESSLSERIVGDTLPAMRFGYSTQPSQNEGAPGFGGIDAALHDVEDSPSISLDDPRIGFVDVNGDGLVDLLHTDPSRYRTGDRRPAPAVFFNGFSGPRTDPAAPATFSSAIPLEVVGGQPEVMSFTNANITTLDLDGDGRVELVHMPDVGAYGYFSFVRNGDSAAITPAAQGFSAAYVARALPAGTLNPRIDLGRDGEHVSVLDVNADGLIDVVRSTGTELQTFVNLGFAQGGDGRFGSYEVASRRLSTDPIRTCLPQAGQAVDFADPEISVAEMNGDGLPDIVRLRRGRVLYFPNAGFGRFGTRDDCRGDTYVDMQDAPPDLDFDAARVMLHDVNADGLSDLVELGFDELRVWFNQAGRGFSDPAIVRDTPRVRPWSSPVRVIDLDGTGTLDLVWGEAGHYRYIDLMGGHKPRLLTRVENGLGALTTLSYSSSVEDYLRDLRAAQACSTPECERFTWNAVPRGCDTKVADATQRCLHRSTASPMVVQVVREVSTSDGLRALGVPESRTTQRFRYHDLYYEGIEQELRGFGAADQESAGDTPASTEITRSYFHQARRSDAIATVRDAENPEEALKGQLYLRERFDGEGRYLGTTHASFVVRRLAHGLDGRDVWLAYAARNDELRYDSTPFTALRGTALTLDAVRFEDRTSAGDLPTPSSHVVRVRGERYGQLVSTVDDIDNLGHVRLSTAFGRVRGEFAEPVPNEAITSHASFINVPGAESGFSWRTERTYATGPGDLAAYGDTTTRYDAEGNAVRVTTQITQARSPNFEAARGARSYGAPAPMPIVTTHQFDPWGSDVAVCVSGDVADPSSCLRFTGLALESGYAQYVEREQTLVSATRSVSTSFEHDRGLGLPTAIIDPNGSRSEVAYDGLGRVTMATDAPSLACPAGTPSTVIHYDIPAEPRTRPLSIVRAATWLDCTGTRVNEALHYIDGLLRTRTKLETGDDDAARRFIQSEVVSLDARGRPERTYEPSFFAGSELDLRDVLTPRASSFVSTGYDAFDRVRVQFERDRSQTWTHYHALSTDVCDALDNDATSPHVGTCTTERMDGHGRVIDRIQRNVQPEGTRETYRLWTSYRADGAVLAITRAQTQGERALPWALEDVVLGRSVSRELVHDSAARLVEASDPDSDDPASGVRHRYLWNPAGDLAAVRDPRGCGQNFFYDQSGRLLGEQYVACEEAFVQHGVATSSVPSGSVGLSILTSAEPVTVRHVYDDYAESWAPNPAALPDFPLNEAPSQVGQLVASEDRGQRSVFAYDARGQLLWSARQMALAPTVPSVAHELSAPSIPHAGPPSSAAPAYDEQHTYVRSAAYDHAGRPVGVTFPSDPDFDDGELGPRVVGTLRFGARGLPDFIEVGLAPATSQVARGRGALSLSEPFTERHVIVAQVQYDAAGNTTATTYGDGWPGRDPTRSVIEYDARRRPIRMRTERAPTEAHSAGRPLGAVSVVADQELVWDRVSNLIEVRDGRIATEWPLGHRPQSKYASHDSLYRVIGVEHDYTDDTGAKTPFDAASDWRNEHDLAAEADPMRERAAPMLPRRPEQRVASLTWRYDWLSNTGEWTDDAHAFFERSLGQVVNGADLEEGRGTSPTLRPSALYLAGDLEGPTDDRGGYVELDYGRAGHAVAMTVHARCVDATGDRCEMPDSGSLAARRARLAQACTCAAEQHHQYLWDEVGRLAEARRYDRSDAQGTYRLAARQRYGYDSDNERTYKQSLAVDDDSERVALYVFADDFERRGLIRGANAYEGDAAWGTESQYLVGGARIVWQRGATAIGLDAKHRITMPITDLVQTTGAVIDLVSGELVEHSTYHPNGAQETYLAAEEPVAPEPLGFTGKEADDEVGLTYFGERYLFAHLGRWMSPDPLHVHTGGGGEPLNGYHYVSGNLLQGRDPLGLDDESPDDRAAQEWLDQNAQPLKTLPDAMNGKPEGHIFIYANDPKDIPGFFSGMSKAKQVDWIQRHQLEVHVFVYAPDAPNALDWKDVFRKGESSTLEDLRTLMGVLNEDIRHCYGPKCGAKWYHNLAYVVIGAISVFGLPEKAPPQAVKNALKKFMPRSLRIGKFVIKIEKKGMGHILRRHHLKFWDGSMKEAQTFLPKHMTVDEVANVAEDVIKQNSELIRKMGTRGMYSFEGVVDGIRYKVGLKNGRVGQLFPIY